VGEYSEEQKYGMGYDVFEDDIDKGVEVHEDDEDAGEDEDADDDAQNNPGPKRRGPD